MLFALCDRMAASWDVDKGRIKSLGLVYPCRRVAAIVAGCLAGLAVASHMWCTELWTLVRSEATPESLIRDIEYSKPPAAKQRAKAVTSLVCTKWSLICLLRL